VYMHPARKWRDRDAKLGISPLPPPEPSLPLVAIDVQPPQQPVRPSFGLRVV